MKLKPNLSFSLFVALLLLTEFCHAQTAGLRLIGTAVGNTAAGSIAIMEVEPSKAQAAFREGDYLSQGRVEKIGAGYVVINDGARLITLGAGQGAVSPLVSRPPPPHRFERQEIDSAVADYARLNQDIRVRPRFEGGRPSGFLIYNIEPGSIFARMGFENGDVVAAVNGQAFETTMPVAEFYKYLSESGLLSFDVKRAERKHSLVVEIQ